MDRKRCRCLTSEDMSYPFHVELSVCPVEQVARDDTHKERLNTAVRLDVDLLKIGTTETKK